MISSHLFQSLPYLGSLKAVFRTFSVHIIPVIASIRILFGNLKNVVHHLMTFEMNISSVIFSNI